MHSGEEGVAFPLCIPSTWFPSVHIDQTKFKNLCSEGGAAMSRIMWSVLVLVLCSFVIGVPSIWANWVHDGVAVCTVIGEQRDPTLASDGTGGVIVTWWDNRNGYHDIYAQRVNASGSVQWTANGIVLSAAASTQQHPAIIPDDAGGAIVTWYDSRSGNNDIYAQRVNASGAVQWTADGVALCTATGNQWHPTIISDGAGGAIVTWYDTRSGNNDVYAQRVNSSGAVQWTANGTALCTAIGNQQYPEIVPDGAGGAIVTWYDPRSGNWDIYAQRVNASGTVQWTADGVALCTAAGDQQYPKIVSDGMCGAIVTWYDSRNGNSDIYAQRVNATGVVQWMADGVALCTDTGGQWNPTIASDDASGAIITWYGDPGNNDIYVQRVNATGVVQWTANGVALCTAAAEQWSPKITSDGAGGAIVTWYDWRNMNYDIYAQRVNALGAVQWAANGVPLCTAAGSQSSPTIVPDGAGGAIVTWEDSRSGDMDAYVQSVDAHGRTGMLAPEIFSIRDVPGDQGGKVYLSWYAAYLDVLMDRSMLHYSIWRAISPTQALMALDAGALTLESLSKLDAMSGKPVVRIEQAGGLTYYWELVETVDALYMEAYGKPVVTLFDSTAACNEYHYFQVVAHTSDPKVFWKSAPDSGYSVDNLAPCPPLCLQGEQSFAPEGLDLRWNRNVEPDFDCYRVYRGLTGDFAPLEGNRLNSSCDTLCFDSGWSWSGGYYYKVSAVDVHGNESGFALLRPEDVTGNETPRVPDASYLSQNYPNPFNPTTRIACGLASPAHLSLVIYNTVGRVVRVLVNREFVAGRYEFFWDGLDGRSVSVSSGVYFYRLDAGAFTQTRKMILLR
jgi:hypothetical protein